ncbi:MAG: PilN domain-containing protein [Planctomycetota bacterium]|nr:PilN domain-containing protein [Planctomycetota bacterium]
MSIVNLLPEDYVAHQAQKRANLMCLLLFVTVMVGLSSAAIVSERRYRRTCEVCERVNRSYEDAGKFIKEMQALDVTRHQMLKKAGLTAALLERVPRSYLLATITKALPKGTSLTKLELSTKYAKTSDASNKPKSKYKIAAGKNKPAPEKTLKKKVDVAVTVTGLAETNVEVGQFIAEMERCPLIKSAEFVFSQEEKVTDSVVREFEVILYLKEDADVRHQSPGTETATVRNDTDKGES